MRRLSRLPLVLTSIAAACMMLTETPGVVCAEAPGSKDAADPAIHGYLSANGMLNRGLFELAAAEYRKFLSEHEDHENAALARYGLGVSLFRMKRYDAAAEQLTPLRKLFRFDFAAEAGTILGQCHLAMRRHAKAAEAFEKVVKRYGEHDLAAADLGSGGCRTNIASGIIVGGRSPA